MSDRETFLRSEAAVLPTDLHYVCAEDLGAEFHLYDSETLKELVPSVYEQLVEIVGWDDECLYDSVSALWEIVESVDGFKDVRLSNKIFGAAVLSYRGRWFFFISRISEGFTTDIYEAREAG